MEQEPLVWTGASAPFNFSSTHQAHAHTRARKQTMGFTLYNLFKSGLLVTNGVAVLHRERFLRKCAWRSI